MLIPLKNFPGEAKMVFVLRDNKNSSISSADYPHYLKWNRCGYEPLKSQNTLTKLILFQVRSTKLIFQISLQGNASVLSPPHM